MAKRKKISRSVRESVYLRDIFTCQYCGLVFDPDQRWNKKVGAAAYIYPQGSKTWVQLEIDHIHPVHRGGDNSLENLRAACQPCNGSKHARLAVQ